MDDGLTPGPLNASHDSDVSPRKSHDDEVILSDDVKSQHSNFSFDMEDVDGDEELALFRRGGFRLDPSADPNDHASFGDASDVSQYSGDNDVEYDDEVAGFPHPNETPYFGHDTGEIFRHETVWEAARKKLAYLQKPNDPLLCREAEHEKLKALLESMLRPYDDFHSVLGGVVFIAGVPGTGKTATARIVATQLRSEMRRYETGSGVSEKQSPFHSLEVNALKLSDPKMIFTHLWWVIHTKVWAKDFGATDAASLQKAGIVSKATAQANLDAFFRGEMDEKLKAEGKQRIPILLLLDEIETLMTNDQQLLYTIFEWARLPTAKLALVGIANMLDLAERVHQKINSRIGTNRIIFSPYQPSQLKDILMQKMEYDMRFFQDESVIDYIAKKVGSSKGDARLTFEVCSRTLRFAELRSFANDPSGETIIPVDNRIVDQTIFAMRDNARLVALESTSLHERIWMLAVLFEIGARRRLRGQVTHFQRQVVSKETLLKLDDDVTFQDATYSRYREFCAQLHLTCQSSTVIQMKEQRICQLGIFLPNWKNRSMQRAIYLKLDPEIILTSLFPDSRLQLLFETHKFQQMFFLTASLS